MATLIQAVAKYRPHIVHRATVELDTIAERLSHGSLVTGSVLRMVLHELEEQLAEALLSGEAVKLPGIGRFEVTIGMDGDLRLRVHADRTLSRRIRKPGAFHGEIAQREHIGLEREALVAKWNAEHPEDPIVESPECDRAA